MPIQGTMALLPSVVPTASDWWPAANASILDRFWNEFSADPKRFGEASREHYARVYAQPGAMHAGFAQFAAFDQDAIDNKAFVATRKLAMRRGDRWREVVGPTVAVVTCCRRQRAAVLVISMPVTVDGGAATVAAVRAFLDEKP